MDYYKRDLIEATFNQLTKSQHAVLGEIPTTGPPGKENRGPLRLIHNLGRL